MAGHVVRYDQTWFYRTQLGGWWQVQRLQADSEILSRDRSRVSDSLLEVTLENLFQAHENGSLPVRLRDGTLVLSIPTDTGTLLRAIQRRPDKTL